ncbi:Ionotropic receptor 546 [Blattella germanica]|nr:Ionotropic receptor 546 [Blattella germanica]
MTTNGIFLDSHTEIIVEKEVSECIVNIVRSYFNMHLPLALQTTGTYIRRNLFVKSNMFGDEVINKFSSENHVSVVILGPPVDMETVERMGTNVFFGSYLLVLTTTTIMKDLKIAKLMMRRLIVNMVPNSKLVIVITRINSIFEEQLYTAKCLLQIIFEYRFVNSIAIIPREIAGVSSLQFDVFGWDPNEQSNLCASKIDKIKHLDTWVAEERTFLLGVNLFPKRPKLNLKDCRLGLRTNMLFPFFYQTSKKEFTGNFLFLISHLVMDHNFSVSFDTGLNPYTQIEFPIFIDTNDANSHCSALYPHIYLDFNWYVPSPLQIPRWKSLFKAMKSETWIVIFSILILGSLTLFLLQKFSSFTDHQSFNISFVNQLMLSMKTQLCIPTKARYKGSTASTTFILWLFYCLIINTAYQSSLFGFTVNPGYEPQIKTLRELNESGLEKIRLFTFNKGSLTSQFAGQFRHYGYCVSDECFKTMAQQRSMALITDSFRGGSAMRSLTSGGHSKITVIKERAFTLYVTIGILKLSCILHEPLQSTMSKLITSGIWDKWSGVLETKKSMEFAFNEDKSKVFAFQLTHLQGAFYLWIVGNFVAIIIFLTEINFSVLKY